MRNMGWGTSVIALALGAGLAGCGTLNHGRADSEGATRASEERALIGGDVIAPVTVPASELAGTTVDLVVGQVLRIDTAHLDVASYRAAIADPDIAVFAQGYRDDGAEFTPGIAATNVGTTEVTLTHEQGGLEPIQFAVSVTPRG